MRLIYLLLILILFVDVGFSQSPIKTPTLTSDVTKADTVRPYRDAQTWFPRKLKSDSLNVGVAVPVGAIKESLAAHLAEIQSQKWVTFALDSSGMVVGQKYEFATAATQTVIDSLKYILLSGLSPSVTPKIYYGGSTSSGTAIIISPSAITANTTITTFDNATVPAGNKIWVEFTTMTSKPQRFILQIK